MKAENSIFSTVHTKDILGFSAQGATDYQEVCKFLDFSKADVAKIAGISENSVRFDSPRIPAALMERFDQIANICQLVADHFGDTHKTALWFKTSNPLLGGISPRDMLRYGRYKRLMQFIIDARVRSGKAVEENQKEDQEA
jgi:hypothetical protein